MKGKKNKLTNLLKTGILFFGISLLLWNCETEKNYLEQLDTSKKGISFISFEELPFNLQGAISNTNALQKSKNSGPLIFDYNRIIKKADSLQKTNYSVRFYIKNQPKNILYNLILHNKKYNRKPYILKFIIENLEEVTKENGRIDFSQMKGVIETYRYQDFIGNVNLTYKKRSNNDPCDRDYDPFHGFGGGGGSTIVWDEEGTFVFNDNNNSGNTEHKSANRNGGCYDNSDDDGTIDNVGGGSSIGINSGSGGNDEADCTNGRIVNGEECEPVEDEQIDSEKLTGKAECLNDHLDKNGNSFIKDILKKFEGDSEFDIKIVSKDKVYRKNTTIELNGKTTEPISGIIEISISTDKFSNMPALGAARTLIHEYIHADIFRKLNTQYPTNGDLDFKTTYEKYETEKQHNAMGELYVTSMKNSLKDFHKNVLVGDYNYLTDNGTNPLPDSFYEALAWQGLKEHNVKAYTDLSSSKKTELTNALNTHYHSTTKNCPE